jgi:hypothetical protein
MTNWLNTALRAKALITTPPALTSSPQAVLIPINATMRHDMIAANFSSCSSNDQAVAGSLQHH